MKLRINYVNAWTVASELQVTGVKLEPCRRMVEVQLTPEQRMALEPAAVGRCGTNIMHEEIESIYLVPEKDDYSSQNESKEIAEDGQ